MFVDEFAVPVCVFRLNNELQSLMRSKHAQSCVKKLKFRSEGTKACRKLFSWKRKLFSKLKLRKMF